MTALTAVPDTPPADCWTALTAAAARPDVPADVQAAILAALAYRDVTGQVLDSMAALLGDRPRWLWTKHR
jgi:hypothetical protein